MPSIIQLSLTDRQQESLWPLVRQQQANRKGLLLFSVAPYVVTENGVIKLRMQAVYLEQSASIKVLKIIEESQ